MCLSILYDTVHIYIFLRDIYLYMYTHICEFIPVFFYQNIYLFFRSKKLHDFRLYVITYQDPAKDMHHLDSQAGVVSFRHHKGVQT